MILVTAAGSHFGKSSIDFLLKELPASDIAAMVRDPEKAADIAAKGVEVRKGDYFDPESLEKAFAGVDTLLFISSGDIQQRSEQHKNVVDAAVKAGVKHIVYTSTQRKSESGSPIQAVADSHLDTEKALKASGIPYTIMRNTLYMDMLPGFLGQQVLEQGVFLPAGDGQVSFAAREDMAEAAARLVLSAGTENRDIVIASDETRSFADVARILSEISGKTVPYHNPDVETYLGTMQAAGVPALYAGLFASFAQAAAIGEFAEPSAGLKELLGREPLRLEEYLHTVYTK
ncbi:MAG: SDR family oxidoreductase [Bacteroidia bacterium]|nr:SDR family oxidoreductase [Bacteroidia bacterium]